MNEERTHALVAGGGFGGLETALYLQARLPEGYADVVLVSDRPEFVFRPYLNYVPFGLQPSDLQFDLAGLAGAHGFRFRPGVAHDAHPDEQTVMVNGEALSYDALFIATGATAGPEAVPGLREHAYTLGREDDMRSLRGALRSLHSSAAPSAAGRRQRVVLLVPPGCPWAGPVYEMAFMLSAWLEWKEVREDVDLMLLTAERRFMDAFAPGVHETLQHELRDRGIGARRHQHPERVEDGALIFPGEGRLRYDLLLAAPTSVSGARWDAFPTDEHGFVRTDPGSRRIEGRSNAYAVGDASDYPVKQGFLALLQADAAAEDWAARQQDETPAFAFTPQATWLMEQFDQALLAKGRLETDVFAPTGDAARIERLPVGQMRRIMADEHRPASTGSRPVNPLYSGLLWKGTETSLKMLRHLARRG